MSRALCVSGSVKRQDRWDLKSSPRSTLQVWNPRAGWPFITGTKPSVDLGQTLRLTENITDTSQRRSRIYKFPPMATHSSTLAWKIPWLGVPGRLQSMGSQRVRQDWATSLHSYVKVQSCTELLSRTTLKSCSLIPPHLQRKLFLKIIISELTYAGDIVISNNWKHRWE